MVFSSPFFKWWIETMLLHNKKPPFSVIPNTTLINMRFPLAIVLLFVANLSVNAQQKVEKFPDSKAEAIINRIISTVGLHPNFEVQQSENYSAAATVLNGKRYIFYNPDFFDKLNEVTGSEWSSISILAHEIGHHLNGHTLAGGSISPQIELEADEFSGFVLKRMGASLDESQQAIKKMASTKDSHTHPARDKRMVAVARGWTNANGQDNLTASNASHESVIEKQPAIVSTTTTKYKEPVKKVAATKPVVSKNYIRYVVRLNSQPKTVYYLTEQNNLVRYYDHKFYIVGTIRPSYESDYPFILKGTNSSFFVTKKGAIVDEKGKPVGYVKVYVG